MKIGCNAIRVGNVLNHQNRLWVVRKTQHVQPGKGGAYMQVEMKAINGSTKINERFRSSDTIERVHLDEESYQFLYKDQDSYIFMNENTYEQITLGNEFIGEQGVFLAENMSVHLSLYEGEVISLKLPETVVLKIESCEPVVKGQTATSSFKPAVLDNTLRIMVPPHIEEGAKVVVNTSDHTYVERFKG